jgi:hypothetical protein
MLETMKDPPKIVFSSLIKKQNDQEVGNKFVPQKIESTFVAKTTTYKKNKKREGKPKLTITKD